ncbi:GumC family protein [Phyllobacterium sp. 628]|uniref:GumC family protein n=1 Tax=Phyllobacterium sp. 628 TaxID=2718938 RepID=UPI0016627F96|nr:GumC family protein [Phyllobacterium sp. 628]QND51926.1 GumC family protein [Phyllobacterium sp. 628]
MGDRDNETGKRPRRSLLSFASQPETAADEPVRVEIPETRPSLHHEDDLEHYQRMRALRLAAGNDLAQPPVVEPEMALSAEEAEQDAVNRMRADMAAIKAELNRRIDDNPPVLPLSFEEKPVLPGKKPEASKPVLQKQLGQPEKDDDEWRQPVEQPAPVNRIGSSRKLIIATTLIGTLLGFGYAMTMPKLYSSNVELLVDPRDLKLTGTEVAPGQLPVDASLAIAESQLRVIQSSNVLSKVIDRAGLAKDPEFNGGLKDKGMLAGLRELFSTDSTPDATARETLLLRNLAEHVDVDRSSKNFVFNITVKSRDPEKSAFIANTVSDVFLEEQSNGQSGVARQATDLQAGRQTELRIAAEQAENVLQKYRVDNGLVDAQGRVISDDEIARTSDELVAARDRTTRLNALAASLRGGPVDAISLNTLPEEFRSDALVALRSQYAELKQQADTLAIKLGPRHPQLIQARSQADGVRKEIRSELDRVASSVQIGLKRSVQQEQDIAARLAQLKSRTADPNENVIKLRELEREASARRAAYEALLLQAKATGLPEVHNSNIRVISPASPATQATGGPRNIIIAGGFLAGLLAGLGIAALRRMRNGLQGGNGDDPVDPNSPAGTKRVQPVDENIPAAGSESRLGAAIKQAQTRGFAAEFDDMRDEDAQSSIDDEIAVAQFLYEYADVHLAERHHDNSNIEEMLSDIADIREILRQRAGH